MCIYAIVLLLIQRKRVFGHEWIKSFREKWDRWSWDRDRWKNKRLKIHIKAKADMFYLRESRTDGRRRRRRRTSDRDCGLTEGSSRALRMKRLSWQVLLFIIYVDSRLTLFLLDFFFLYGQFKRVIIFLFCKNYFQLNKYYFPNNIFMVFLT